MTRFGARVRAGRVAGTSLVVVLASLVASCGAPHFTYVTNSTDHLYFKVPHTWHRVDQRALENTYSELLGESPDSAAAAVRREVDWSIAYDAASPASPNHLASTSQPFVFAVVHHLSSSQSGVVSLNALRDFLLPVTDSGLQQLQQQGAQPPQVEVLADEVLTPGDGVHGVREVFNYIYATGQVHTFDKTVITTDNAAVLYMLLIQCTSKCYTADFGDLNTIATSFTVRKNR